MPTATAFLFPKVFPFCLTDISADIPANYSGIQNLTLAQIMAFAWNANTFTIGGTGSVTYSGDTAVGDWDYTLNAAASSNCTEAELVNGGMWFGSSFGVTSLGSWPAIRQPINRICMPGSYSSGGILDLSAGNGTAYPNPGYSQTVIKFRIGTDPGNSGKYILYYRIWAGTISPGGVGVEIYWSNESTPATGFTSIYTNNSSLFGISGITLTSFGTTGGSYSGGNWGISSESSFTY